MRAGLAQAQLTLAAKSGDSETYGYSESDPNEARYWMNHYGLGTREYSRPQRQFAHPRKLLLQPTAQTSIIRQVLFGPAATTATTAAAPSAEQPHEAAPMSGSSIVELTWRCPSNGATLLGPPGSINRSERVRRRV